MKRKYISQDPESGQTYPAMQEPQHTPTPWELVRQGNQGDYVIVGDYMKIVKPAVKGGTISDVQRDLDNAAFIVRAVNSHEAYERAVRNTFLRLKRVFEIETEFKPDVRILLAEALMFAYEGMETIKQAEVK